MRIIALLVIALASCSNPTTKEPDTSTPRIVSIGGTLTEILFALDQGDSIIGVDSSSLFPVQAQSLPQIGSHHKISVEQVLALAPTIVVASSSTPVDSLEQIRSAGVRVHVIEDVTTLDGVGTRIEAVAKAIDAYQQGKELSDQVREEIKTAIAEAKSDTAVRAMFIYARGGRVLSVAGTSTSADVLLIAAGAINAASDSKGFRPLNSEAAVAAAPDILVMMESGAKSIEAQGGAFALPGISLTPAGKHRRIVEMNGLLLLGLGPRTGQAIRELHKQIEKEMNRQK